MEFITREEAEKALENGQKVLFHYRGKSTEVNLNTSLEDLRSAFLAKLTLTANDVLNGKYSIIKSQEDVVEKPYKLFKFFHEIRLENGELLKDMADKLGLGLAELSSIEHGKKTMPKGFMDKLQKIYFSND